MLPKVVYDDIEVFLATLPLQIKAALKNHPDQDNLAEVILDLGRVPIAVFHDHEQELAEEPINQTDLHYVIERLGQFGGDNRAGIEQTLHRFSAIRNRAGDIIGLTCRVGRAVQGTAEILRDLIESGKSILMMGRPGIGKTTLLRESARILSTDIHKRVVIVDTSNEIAGDGNIPHPAIGKARRTQVSHPREQHSVMIEAVENHMPQAVIIDEMGTELEADAARTIAERGVQLIATAHGNTLQNLMANPTLDDLVGGIENVTLGDEEAKRRGTQKTVLERRSPPTFDIIIEIQKRWEMIVHPDTATSVDRILRGMEPPSELRKLDEEGNIVIEKFAGDPLPTDDLPPINEHGYATTSAVSPELPVLNLYYLGVSRRFITQGAKNIGIEINYCDNVDDADVILTDKKMYKKRPKSIRDAEGSGIPLYMIREDTRVQVENCLLNVLQNQLQTP